jgi:hypothetical protein
MSQVNLDELTPIQVNHAGFGLLRKRPISPGGYKNGYKICAVDNRRGARVNSLSHRRTVRRRTQ